MDGWMDLVSRSSSLNTPAFSCCDVLQQAPRGTISFMCHVSQRLDCRPRPPTIDMVINALRVIAGGGAALCVNPALKIHTCILKSQISSLLVGSGQSGAF